MTKSRIPNLQSLIPKTICLALVISTLLVAPSEAQSPPPDRRFGAVEAFRDSGAAAEAGVGWERILFYWSELQREGPGEWNGYHVPDEWLNQAAAADREVVAVLKHTPAWATDGPPGCGVPRGLDLPVDDPGNLWAAFVRRTVEIYRGRIRHWIIWNEPDIAPGEYGAEWCGSIEEYYQLLKVAYLAAHEVDPDAVIHLAGLTYFHDTVHGRSYYLERFLDVAEADPTGAEHGYYFDVVSLHIYFEIANFDTILGKTHAALAAHGLDKPIWVNETDAPPNDDPSYPLPDANYKVSMEEQASFLLQAFSLALSEGADRIAVYKWVVADPPMPGAEPNGVVRPDGSRRPAFDAYKLITTHYAGTISASEDRQSLYTVITLDRGAATTRVLWARTQAEAMVSLPAQSTQARLIDQTGAEQTVTPVDGQYTVTLPGARCADTRGCIIGGFTYLLIEEGAMPTPTAIPTAIIPTETPTPTVPTEPPTPLPTETPTPAPTLTPTLTNVPTATSTPTPTSTPLPISTATPLPTQTPLPTATSMPLPSVPPTPEPSVWPLLIGLAAVFLLAAIIGSMFKYRD
jgi:hypothetical protein